MHPYLIYLLPWSALLCWQVVLLTAMMTVILLRVLRKDIAQYMEEEDTEAGAAGIYIYIYIVCMCVRTHVCKHLIA